MWAFLSLFTYLFIYKCVRGSMCMGVWACVNIRMYECICPITPFISVSVRVCGCKRERVCVCLKSKTTGPLSASTSSDNSLFGCHMPNVFLHPLRTYTHVLRGLNIIKKTKIDKGIAICCKHALQGRSNNSQHLNADEKLLLLFFYFFYFLPTKNSSV